jgi:hypothetical protein
VLRAEPVIMYRRPAGIFDDGDVEEFIADLYAVRRSDVA